VQTSTAGAGEARIWLFDRDGGNPVVAYTSDYPESLLPEGDFAPLAHLFDLAWSPDGSRLGFVEDYSSLGAGQEVAVQTRAVAIDVSAAGTGPATELYVYDTEQATTRIEDQITGGAFLWSADGARVAVLDGDQILELSAEDGSVLARQPADALRSTDDVGWLVWPAEH
jgi:dipeptidyl aminopeptidase/acylaminoacyl peptidase